MYPGIAESSFLSCRLIIRSWLMLLLYVADISVCVSLMCLPYSLTLIWTDLPLCPIQTLPIRTSLDDGSGRRRNPYLTTPNVYEKEKSTLPAVFEPAIPASERPQTNALERAATANELILFGRLPMTYVEMLSIWSE